MESKAPLNAWDGWLPIWLLNHRNISAIISDRPEIAHQSSQKYELQKMDKKYTLGDRIW